MMVSLLALCNFKVEPCLSQLGGGSISLDNLSIVAPPGAVDALLSTEQQFRVEADISFDNADDIKAEIVLPQGFEVIGGSSVQSVNEPGPQATVAWLLKAPTVNSEGFIRVNVTGKDGNIILPRDITADPDSIFVAAITQAQLEFAASISMPESAVDRQLTVGQRFTITATLENVGAASLVGHDSVRIVLPSGFQTIEAAAQRVDPLPIATVSWEIEAPEAPTSVSDIAIEVLQLSQDENSNEAPPLNQRVVVISVTVTPIQLTVTPVANLQKNVAIRGQKNVSLFELEFRNDSDSDIRITEILLQARNGGGLDISPSGLFDRLAVVDVSNQNIHLAELSAFPSENPIRLRFDSGLQVTSLQTSTVEFQGDILLQTTEGSFQIVVESPAEDIIARDESENAVRLVNAAGEVFVDALASASFRLLDPDLQSSFFSYPNPFNVSEREHANFVYHLPEDSDLSVRIYTLLGELVWARSFRATEGPGSAGLHDREVTWNGKNDRGHAVLNGIYVAILEAETGTAMTKIALVK